MILSKYYNAKVDTIQIILYFKYLDIIIKQF